jgi:hypothetical protein
MKNIFEGKSPSERNKLIAAMALGGMALLSLVYTFGGTFFGGSKARTVNVNVSPTPTASASPGARAANDTFQLPSQEMINQEWLITPISYSGTGYAPEAGRNIFAFYEPPAPTPYEPTPEPVKMTPTPTPMPPPPPPPITVAFISPQNIYAGSKSFRLEVNGDKFTPDSVIIWNGSQVPTNFVSPQKLTADIQSSQIVGEGQRTIMVRTLDNTKFSNQVMLNVEAPPKPNFLLVGVRLTARNQNNTATLQERDKPNGQLFTIRLNDTVGGRFKAVSISEREVILEDTSLGFRHPVPLTRDGAGGGGGMTGPGSRPGDFSDRFPNRFPQQTPNYNYTPPPPSTYNPTMPGNTIQPQEIPGIPNNIQRSVPQQPQPQQQRTPRPPRQQKDDDDDDDDGDGRP